MSKMQNLAIAGVVLSTLLTLGCVQEKTKYIERQAPLSATESFSAADTKDCQKLSCVSLRKEALGKVFLLVASGVSSGPTAEWVDLKPLVVSFEKSGSKLALVAENYLSVYEEIQTKDLVQTFKVISENDETITFDWGDGIKSFALDEPYDTDFAPLSPESKSGAKLSREIMDSFVTKIKFTDKHIELNQLSKLRYSQVVVGSSKMQTEVVEETLNLNIQIQSYNLSNEFKIKEPDSLRRVGFFTTKVGVKGYSDTVRNLISKWDLAEAKGPIRVRISKAVPQEHLEAVRGGALYWNKVFGREVIQVETGVAIDAAAENRSISIRWIPWVNATGAWAKYQADPLSGEIIRAQIFMPSAFVNVSSYDTVHFNKGVPVAPGSAVACDFQKSLQEVHALANQLPKGEALRLVSDALYSTIAHEMGHALGLRHNFAGSFSAKVSAREALTASQEYLEDPQHPGLEVSTSVMDYLNGVDNSLLAGRMKKEALAYDKMAMDWAYADNDSGLDVKISKYCSDEHIMNATSAKLNIHGCERFDSGNNPIETTISKFLRERDTFVKSYVAAIYDRYATPSKKNYKILPLVISELTVFLKSQINLSAIQPILFDNRIAGKSVFKMTSISSALNGEFQFSQQGFDSDYETERLQAIESLGGYAQILKTLMLDKNGKIAIDWLDTQLQDLEKNQYYRTGQTHTGYSYALNDAEVKLLKEFFLTLPRMNNQVFLDAILEIFPTNETKKDDRLGISIVVEASLPRSSVFPKDLEILVDIYSQLLQAEAGVVTARGGPGLVNIVKIPEAKIPAEYRTKFANLLSPKGLSAPTASVLPRVKKIQIERIQSVLSQIDKGLKLEEASDFKVLAQTLFESSQVDGVIHRWLEKEFQVLAKIIALEKE